MKQHPIIIVGSGLAGYTLAKEFRQLDKRTPLLIVTASDGRFYSKPLLSTALTKEQQPTTLAIASAIDMEKQLNATILTQREVTQINSAEHSILINEKKFFYSKLILACGAKPIKPPIIGDAAQNILSVNDLESYTLFRETLLQKKHIVILGAGLVGCEFANDLINVGHEVDVIAPSNYPLDNFLPERIGLLLQAALSEGGVQWHLGQTAIAINHSPKGYAITLSSQRNLIADIVLSAIGLQPNIELAKQAGIKINRGVVVNQFLQTSLEDIYALGDCAEVNGLVLLFIAPLRTCAHALARTLVGENTAVKYPAMPVSIKTPTYPIAVVTPPRGTKGSWHFQGQDHNLEALFYHNDNKLQGFVLTGKMIKEKNNLVKQLSPSF